MKNNDEKMKELESEGIFFEHYDNKHYACVMLDDGGVVMERIPLHILKLPPSEQEFHFRSVAKNLRNKVFRYKADWRKKDGQVESEQVVGDVEIPCDTGGAGA